jgi:hypothetical protein
MARQATVPKAEIPTEPLPAANGDKPKTEALSLVDVRKRAEELARATFDGILQQVSFGEETNQAIAECLQGSIEKRDDMVELIKAVEAEGGRLKEMESRIYERRKEYEKFVDLFRMGIRVQMENWGLKRVDGRIHRLSIRDGFNRVVVDDESLLPAEFLNWKPIPDKDALSKALHAGAVIPGAHLEHGESILTIK